MYGLFEIFQSDDENDEAKCSYDRWNSNCENCDQLFDVRKWSLLDFVIAVGVNSVIGVKHIFAAKNHGHYLPSCN